MVPDIALGGDSENHGWLNHLAASHILAVKQGKRAARRITP